jgi:predicted transcriptional regulator
MNVKVRNIEVKLETAELLEARAAARGTTVAEVVAELVALDDDSSVGEAGQLAELDRRWKSVEAGAKTVPHDEVVRWLETWGTPAYRPWRDR